MKEVESEKAPVDLTQEKAKEAYMERMRFEVESLKKI